MNARAKNTYVLLKHYLGEQYMMQLATVRDGQPWCCSVYYVVDDELNLYWASWPTRRHSREIATHNKVAAAIPVQFGKDETVIGIQVQGRAEEVNIASEIKPIAKTYAAAFGRDDAWVEHFSARKTKHRLYRLVPDSIVLFDEVNFPEEPRQVIGVN